MKTFATLLLALATITLAGCCSTPIRAAQKAGIKTVTIEPRIDADQAMRYGVDRSGGGLANGLASIIVDSMGQEGIQRMSAVMQSNHIVVADMVRTHATACIQQYRELQLTNSQSDGVVTIKIKQYGFDVPGFRFSKKVPIIVLRAELLNQKGKRLWSRETKITHLTTDGLGATWDEYEAHPERLRDDWDKQTENVTLHLFPVQEQ